MRTIRLNIADVLDGQRSKASLALYMHKVDKSKIYMPTNLLVSDRDFSSSTVYVMSWWWIYGSTSPADVCMCLRDSRRTFLAECLQGTTNKYADRFLLSRRTT